MRTSLPSLPRVHRWFVHGLLLALTLLGLYRGVDLARHGWQPTAIGESRWFQWATGNPTEQGVRTELARQVPRGSEGDGVVVQVLQGSQVPQGEPAPGAEPVRADWVHVMAQYEWPAVRVLAVEIEGQGRSGPPPEQLSSLAPDSLARISVARTAVAESPPRTGLPEPPGHGGSGFSRSPWLWGFGFLLLLGSGLWVFAGSGTRPGSRVTLEPAHRGRADGDLARGGLAHREPFGAHTAAGVLLGTLALFVWKVLAAPLWSWDHHAIWGMKARRMAELGTRIWDSGTATAGEGAAGWLAGPAFPYAATDYPLGWPGLLALASLGEAAGPALFKGAHLLCGVVLVLAVRETVLRGGGEGPRAMAHRGAAAAGALVAVSPLLWDTESLGLADLPLATLATLAVLLAVDARRKLGSPKDRLASGGVAAGLLATGMALGGLPWIKQEGWPLGVWLLLAAGLLVVWGFEAGSGPRSGRWAGLGGRAGRWQSLALLVGPCAALWGLQPLVHAPLTAPATGFLSGRWTERVVEHLPELPTILGHMAVDLLRWDWCLLWALFALASFLAVRNRHRRYRLPAILGGVVLAQLGVYTFIYLATYLDPAAHILSSFVRIAAALVPLAAITAFLVLAPTDS